MLDGLVPVLEQVALVGFRVEVRVYAVAVAPEQESNIACRRRRHEVRDEEQRARVQRAGRLDVALHVVRGRVEVTSVGPNRDRRPTAVHALVEVPTALNEGAGERGDRAAIELERV